VQISLGSLGSASKIFLKVEEEGCYVTLINTISCNEGHEEIIWLVRAFSFDT
jgi:hypothetical protein